MPAEKTAEKTAALLIAHGSRREEANLDLVRLADAVRARDAYPIVEIAYLELARPSVLEGGSACVAQGARKVFMVPYFLSEGAHVADDLSRLRRDLAQQFREVTFKLCSPLSRHPLLVEIVLDRLREAAK